MERLFSAAWCLGHSAGPYLLRDRSKRAGFTLIETALALGIVAFALVPLVALLPIGLQVSRNASDLTMGAQIAQRLSGMIAQDDYSDYAALVQNQSLLESNFYFFDSEGQPIINSNGKPVNADGTPATPLYTALIETGAAYSALNGVSNGNSDSQANSTTTATLVVQIANDPGQLWNSVGPGTAPPSTLRGRTVTIPIYFAGTGG